VGCLDAVASPAALLRRAGTGRRSWMLCLIILAVVSIVAVYTLYGER
jgi:hypothetical protein